MSEKKINQWSILPISIGVMVLLAIVSCKDSQHQLNRLKNAYSPYLKEHADNPVDWYEWGEEALSKAKKENKPLLISIGYASCHWCHEMEKESFMDTAVARLMNKNFICIKVDREERTDIDNLYIHACQLLNGGEAGWPLNAFALPDGKPFFAGTYYSRDNWINLLKQVVDTYKNKYNKVLLQANSLIFGIIENDSLLLQIDNEKGIAKKEMLNSVFDAVYQRIDLTYGGLKGKQKFPTPSLWEFMLQYNYHTGNKLALEVVINTLTKMARGGIYDQIGGGFARYTIDSIWRVPHFEKMLNDNAQLTSLYAHAYQVTKIENFRTVAKGILSFIESELAAENGGFYSSINADTKQGEGEFYAWSTEELTKVVGIEDSKKIDSFYNVSTAGNWKKGMNILFTTQDPADFASANKIEYAQFEKNLTENRDNLLTERNKRNRPTVDEKILTHSNALLLQAYTDAFKAFGDEKNLNTALFLAGFIEKNMLENNGKLFRNFNERGVKVEGFLDDYSFLAKAYIKLYEVSFDRHWLDLSSKITDYAINNFYDKKSGFFFYTVAGKDELVIRKIEILNNVVPSSVAVMGEVLYALGTFFENEDYLEKYSGMLAKISPKVKDWITSSPQWGSLLGNTEYDNYEVAIMGADALKLNSELQKNYLPTCLFMGGKKEDLPLMENKLTDNGTFIYVCSNKVCKMPEKYVSKALQKIK